VKNQDLFKHKFYKVSDSSGDMELEEITHRPLKKTDLDTNDVFILELKKMIYIWCGKESNYNEKNNAITTARKFRDQKEKPKSTSITKIPQFGEDALFKSYFHDFYILKGVNLEKAETGTGQLEELFDKSPESETNINTDAPNSIKTYVIVDDELVEIDESENGHFYEDNVYIVDVNDSHDRRYLYLWVGNKKSFQDLQYNEKYFGELTEYTIGDDTVRVRMRKGKEPAQFIALFEDGIVLHEGERGVENTEKQVFCVFSPFGKHIKAMEINISENLYFNSGNVYYLITPDNTKVYKWIGNGSNESERNYHARGLLDDKEVIEIKEGEEPADLWLTFFDQETRPETLNTFQRKMTGIREIEPRLFSVCNESGNFKVTEIYDFGHEDLNRNDIMILDAYDTIYIWIGEDSNPHEKKKGLKLCSCYIELCVNDGRDTKINITEVVDGNEPGVFKSFFPDWDEK
jgi:hypothetical protein